MPPCRCYQPVARMERQRNAGSAVPHCASLHSASKTRVDALRAGYYPGLGRPSMQERAGAISFVDRHGLWSAEQVEAATRAEKLIEDRHLDVVRLSFADQHGILRGKTVVAGDAPSVMRNGCPITTTLL